MSVWEVELKWYPHFDALIGKRKLEAIANDPAAVARNPFLPFLHYVQSWQPYRSRPLGRPARKERPIRYASRRDAAIYSRYRCLLSDKYEAQLDETGIGDVVIAYRRLKDANGRGMSTIESAREAFAAVDTIGDCAAVALDISSFFDCLDHERLAEKWRHTLGVSELPPDHQAIFRSLTRYAVVDRDEAYRRLGFLADTVVDGRVVQSYTKPARAMPKKLCENREFRQKIGGVGTRYKSLIQVNRKPWGIPQGSPMSDLLANMYLLDFDQAMKAYATQHGGLYRRYSDDLLIVVPGGAAAGTAACDFAKFEIEKQGSKLKIKDKKTMIMLFEKQADGMLKCVPASTNPGKQGLEYLGFRYDGRHVRLRDSTLSRLYRKLSCAIKRECHDLVARYPGKDVAFLEAHFPYKSFFQRYGRVEGFKPSSNVRTWTFWTYAQKASRAFGRRGQEMPKQLRHQREVVRRRVRKTLVRLVEA